MYCIIFKLFVLFVWDLGISTVKFQVFSNDSFVKFDVSIVSDLQAGGP